MSAVSRVQCSCCSVEAKLVDSLPVWPGKPPGGACGSPYGTAAATRISVYGLLCSTPPPAGGGTQGQKTVTCGGSYFPLLNVCDPCSLVSPPRCAWFCSGALSDVPPLSPGQARSRPLLGDCSHSQCLLVFHSSFSAPGSHVPLLGRMNCWQDADSLGLRRHLRDRHSGVSWNANNIMDIQSMYLNIR